MFNDYVATLIFEDFFFQRVVGSVTKQHYLIYIAFLNKAERRLQTAFKDATAEGAIFVFPSINNLCFGYCMPLTVPVNTTAECLRTDRNILGDKETFWIYKQTKVLTVGFMAPFAWTLGQRFRLRANYVHAFVFHVCVAICALRPCKRALGHFDL
jgi:hypothetical protein